MSIIPQLSLGKSRVGNNTNFHAKCWEFSNGKCPTSIPEEFTILTINESPQFTIVRAMGKVRIGHWGQLESRSGFCTFFVSSASFSTTCLSFPHSGHSVDCGKSEGCLTGCLSPIFSVYLGFDVYGKMTARCRRYHLTT